MTALFGTRRRAEEFAAAVDEGARAVPDDLRPLVALAGTLRRQADDVAAAPRAEFAADLRSRLMAEAEVTLAPGAPLVLPVRERGPRERRLAVAASVAVLLGGSAGMAVAAQDALPGEALYPVKRGIEKAEAGLSVSTAGRGHDLLRQADGRLLEVEGLLSGPASAAPQVPSTVEDFIEQAQEGSDLLFTSYEEDRDPETLRAVRDFTSRGIEMLQRLARNAPAESQDELAAAALTLAEIDRRAVELCGSCGDLAELRIPGIFLASAEADRALAALTAERLDNSHPLVVDKRLVRLVEGTGPALPLDGGDGSTTSTGEEPPAAPEEPEDSEPLIKLPTETDVTKSDPTVDDTVGDLTDGLSGVVETLLPDPLAE